MQTITQTAPIYDSISKLESATVIHNSTFDEANKIFCDAEASLGKIAFDYWYPVALYPITQTNDVLEVPQAFVPITISTLQPYEVITYQIGFIAKRLVIKKIVSKYDYRRDQLGNIVFTGNYPYFYPTPILMEMKEEKVLAIADCSRELRVLAIENLPNFIDYVCNSIKTHTRTLDVALGHIQNR